MEESQLQCIIVAAYMMGYEDGEHDGYYENEERVLSPLTRLDQNEIYKHIHFLWKNKRFPRVGLGIFNPDADIPDADI